MHALLGSLMIILACRLSGMFKVIQRQRRSSSNVNVTPTTTTITHVRVGESADKTFLGALFQRSCSIS